MHSTHTRTTHRHTEMTVCKILKKIKHMQKKERLLKQTNVQATVPTPIPKPNRTREHRTCLDRRYGIRAQSAGDSFVTVSYPPTQVRAQSAHNGLTSQVEVEHAFLGRARLAPCSSAHPARLAVRDLLDACQAVLEGGLAADRASLIIVEQASVDLLDGQRGGGLPRLGRGERNQER